MDSIGKRLEGERKRLGKSSVEFAALVGVHRNTQPKYEKDETTPDAAYWEAAQALGVNVAFVTSGRLTVDRLINMPTTYESDIFADYWLLLASQLEESMLSAGAVAGRDYTYKDLWAMTQPMVQARLGQLKIGLNDRVGTMRDHHSS